MAAAVYNVTGSDAGYLDGAYTTDGMGNWTGPTYSIYDFGGSWVFSDWNFSTTATPPDSGTWGGWTGSGTAPTVTAPPLTHSFSGHVAHADDSDYEGVTVTAETNAKSAVTDADGLYEITGCADGEETLTPSLVATELGPHGTPGDAMPSPFAAAASSNQAGKEPHKAFDNDVNGGGVEYTAWRGNSTDDWLRLDFGSGNAYIVGTYSIKAWGWSFGYASTVQQWLLQGSNDLSTWDTLDTVSGQTGWAANEVRTFECDVQTTAYRYIRVLCTGTNVSIGELSVFSPTPEAETWDPATRTPTMSGADVTGQDFTVAAGGTIQEAAATCAVSLGSSPRAARIQNAEATASVDLGLEDLAQALLAGQATGLVQMSAAGAPSRVRAGEATADLAAQGGGLLSRILRGAATAETTLAATGQAARLRGGASTVSVGVTASGAAGALRQAAATVALALRTAATAMLERFPLLATATAGIGLGVAAVVSRLRGGAATASAEVQGAATGQRTCGGEATAAVTAGTGATGAATKSGTATAGLEVGGTPRATRLQQAAATAQMLLRVAAQWVGSLWQGTPRAMRARATPATMTATKGAHTMKASAAPDMEATTDPREE
jgi:hypothetical protein